MAWSAGCGRCPRRTGGLACACFDRGRATPTNRPLFHMLIHGGRVIDVWAGTPWVLDPARSAKTSQQVVRTEEPRLDSGLVNGGVAFDPAGEARRRWDAHGDSDRPAAIAAVTSITRMQQILMSRLNEALKPFEPTFPRHEALMISDLSRRASMLVGKIGERLQIHPASVTSLIDGLEKSGYIRRLQHAHCREE